MKKTLLASIIAGVLASCGTGNGDVYNLTCSMEGKDSSQIILPVWCLVSGEKPPTNPPSVPRPELPPLNPLSTSVNLLPDLKVKYDKLCGRDVNAQQIVPVDLNKDGLKDLVIAVWCFLPIFKQNVDIPVKNTIIALTQNPDGSFKDTTAEIFGVDMPDIGGIAIGHTAHDFNNDGYTDIVFAINREDGRVGTGSMENFKSPQMSLMSMGNGTYRLVPIGTPQYGMYVSTRTNSFNSKDIIFTGYHGTNKGYRWSGSTWQELSGYSEWTNNPLFLVSNPNIAVQAGSREELGIDLYANSNSSWNKSYSYSFSGSTKWVDQISWSGGIGKVPLITIGGEDYITPGFAGFCEIKSENSVKIIAFMSGTVIVGGYKGGTIKEGTDPVYKYKSVNKLLTFTVNGSSMSKDALEIDLSTEPTNISYYNMKCGDINNDGIFDIHIVSPLGWRANTPTGPKPSPIVFIGQPGFTFKRVKGEVFSPIPDGSAALLDDLNGDTVADLVYWPLTGYNGSDEFEGNDALIKSNSVRYKFYKGLRNFNSNDLN